MKIAVLEKRFIKMVFPKEGKPKPMAAIACTLLAMMHVAPSNMEEGPATLTSFYPKRSKHPSHSLNFVSVKGSRELQAT